MLLELGFKEENDPNIPGLILTYGDGLLRVITRNREHCNSGWFGPVWDRLNAPQNKKEVLAMINRMDSDSS